VCIIEGACTDGRTAYSDLVPSSDRRRTLIAPNANGRYNLAVGRLYTGRYQRAEAIGPN